MFGPSTSSPSPNFTVLSRLQPQNASESTFLSEAGNYRLSRPALSNALAQILSRFSENLTLLRFAHIRNTLYLTDFSIGGSSMCSRPLQRKQQIPMRSNLEGSCMLFRFLQYANARASIRRSVDGSDTLLIALFSKIPCFWMSYSVSFLGPSTFMPSLRLTDRRLFTS